MKTSVVLGLGYGDEGKGVVVNSLASQSSSALVIRFSGGHQCGHTVIHDNVRHIFSNFGSGTLVDIPTYWSRYCTINPTSIVREYEILVKKGIKPILFIDRDCPIIIPMDIASNQLHTNYFRNGTVGVGFGAAIERNEKGYRLVASDMLDKTLFRTKLSNINERCYDRTWEEKEFLADVETLNNLSTVTIINDINKLPITNTTHIICEGSQGILLDQTFGFFPYVTRANTTSQNMWELFKQLPINYSDINIYYVTRCYQTRHGNGPMFPSIPLDQAHAIVDFTNVTNPYQGVLRMSSLSGSALNYALDCDARFISSIVKKKLVITCIDQIESPFVSWKGTKYQLEPFLKSVLMKKYNFTNIYQCNSPNGNITELTYQPF